MPTDDVVADDYQIAHPVQTALALAPILHVPATTLAAQLHRPTGYVVLARQLPQLTGQQISADAFPGISLIADSRREVPNGNLAAPVVGFTNGAGQGAAGLEYGDNRLLAGVDGKETIMESPGGVALPQSPVTNQSPPLRAPVWSSRSTPSSSTNRSRRWPRPSRRPTRSAAPPW